MPRIGTGLAIATNLNPSLVALKPRQLLLLAKAKAKATTTMSESESDQRSLLLTSVAHYLHRCGFSKTSKIFRSEAKIQPKHDSTPDLEQIFNNYLETTTCNHDTNANSQKEQVAQKGDIPNTKQSDTVVAVEALSKKKKKKSKDNDGFAALGESKTSDTKESEVMIMNGSTSQLNGKIKEKKKSKKICDSLGQGTEHMSPEAHEEPVQKNVSESQLEKPNKGDKEKRIKKSKLSPESLGGDGENHLESESKDVTNSEKENKSKTKKKKKDKIPSENEKDNIKSSVVDVSTKETKVSKKRKRLASEENDSKPVNETSIEESELRKTGIDANSVKQSAGANGQASSNEMEKTPMKQLKGCDNGNLDRSVEKSSKKQRIGFAEPTSLKAFQRVKVDEVVFTDERLQDNSYWAKDGAETGYGAKAQEVLGQVRGRDFRHEKTKKKRGSYRGGQIDLQSHSVKFNYSDEE